MRDLLERDLTAAEAKCLLIAAPQAPTARTLEAYAIADRPLASYTTKEPEGRHTTPELRRLIHRLGQRGFVTGAIARTLNLKEARVKRILREPLAV
jgi:hypothetical protein